MTDALPPVHPEVWLGAGYAVLLVVAAFGLEYLARRAHQRSDAYELAGFVYHRQLDVWECPTGQHLLPSGIDHLRQRIHYRARPTACNSCPLKSQCTESDTGREIVQHRAAWPHSEVARFHRGISLFLLLVAAVMIVVVGARHLTQAELALLAGPVALVLVAARRLWPAFQATPPAFE